MSVEQDLADRYVRTMYAGFDVGGLQQLLDVGRRFVGIPEADAMNAALQKEIDRRKALWKDVSHG